MSNQPNENYAARVHSILSREYDAETEDAKKSGEIVKLECTTDFGIVTVVWISACTMVDLIRMEAVGENNKHFLMYIPAIRCSFRFSRFKPAKGESKEVGFVAKPVSN